VLWSIFVLLGIERARIVPGITRSVPLDLEYMPISHSLVAGVGWGVLFAGIYFALHKELQVAIVLFLGVLSHWLLDYLSHRPDMPLLPSGPRGGLGLWNYPLPAFLTEAVMLLAGGFLYLHATRPRAGGKNLGVYVLLAVLFAFNCAAYTAAPPP